MNSQAEIGKSLGGLDYTAVSRERKCFRERTERDKNVESGFGRNWKVRNVVSKKFEPFDPMLNRNWLFVF
jgi:hypothetical protein